MSSKLLLGIAATAVVAASAACNDDLCRERPINMLNNVQTPEINAFDVINEVSDIIDSIKPADVDKWVYLDSFKIDYVKANKKAAKYMKKYLDQLKKTENFELDVENYEEVEEEEEEEEDDITQPKHRNKHVNRLNRLNKGYGKTSIIRQAPKHKPITLGMEALEFEPEVDAAVVDVMASRSKMDKVLRRYRNPLPEKVFLKDGVQFGIFRGSPPFKYFYTRALTESEIKATENVELTEAMERRSPLTILRGGFRHTINPCGTNRKCKRALGFAYEMGEEIAEDVETEEFQAEAEVNTNLPSEILFASENDMHTFDIAQAIAAAENEGEDAPSEAMEMESAQLDRTIRMIRYKAGQDKTYKFRNGKRVFLKRRNSKKNKDVKKTKDIKA